MQLGSGNGTSFPTSVDTATTEVNSPASGKTKARAEVINDLLSAVIAIETSLNTGTGYVVYPSTQRVVTASRAFGTIYQNTTGRPLFVNVSGYSTTTVIISGITDTNSSPTTIVDTMSGGSGEGIKAHLIVLAGSYYKVTMSAGTPVLTSWTEWY